MAPPPRPTHDELQAAAGRTVPDLLAPELRVLFCGINPGLYSGATGHHFARPGNRFWPAMAAAGFTGRRLQAWEEHELLALGYGITNLVARATASAAELSPDELRSGALLLADKVASYRPQLVAMLGISTYRVAFGRPHVQIGPQPERLHDARLWVLPNPSGLNAHYPPVELARTFAALRTAIENDN